MILQYLSDIHLEFQRGHRPRPGDPCFEHIPETIADAVILAGDIDTKLRGIDWAIAESQRLAKAILYVFGNHEFYGDSITHMVDKARARCVGTGVQVLEKDAVIIGSTRVLGCTLWSDFLLNNRFAISLQEVREGMNDYRRIRFGPAYHRLNPMKVAELHADARNWLESHLTGR